MFKKEIIEHNSVSGRHRNRWSDQRIRNLGSLSQEISDSSSYVKTLIGFWSDDREDQNSIEMRNDAEVHFRASSTSDTGGLDYGIAIELGAGWCQLLRKSGIDSSRS